MLLSATLLSFALTTCFAQDILWVQGDAVDRSCESNFDCRIEGARCYKGQCMCLSTHVNVDGRCMPKVRPGDSPCSRDEQCTAVWPDTRCLNQICQCKQGSIAVKTRDGIYCLEEYESCPFGGKDAVLRDETGKVASCFVNPMSGYMSGCLGQLSMYDCVKDTEKATYYCCPNKGNVCSQQLNPGVLPAPTVKQGAMNPQERRLPWYLQHRDRYYSNIGGSKKWYFDRITGDCKSFDYRGAGGSANNFKSKQHCEYICKTTCPRGSPMFQKDSEGRVIQFAQRQQLCNPKIGCGDPQYECQILQPGMALCCPNKEFLCSEFGGVPQKLSVSEYDTGIFCGNNTLTVTRYFYSRQSRRCQTFEFKGCSGNHNNFATQSDCENFCINSRFFFQRDNVDGEITTKAPFQFIWPNTNRPTFG